METRGGLKTRSLYRRKGTTRPGRAAPQILPLAGSPRLAVMGREAHEAVGQLDLLLPGQIGQGNYLKPPFDDSILAAPAQDSNKPNDEPKNLPKTAMHEAT